MVRSKELACCRRFCWFVAEIPLELWDAAEFACALTAVCALPPPPPLAFCFA